MKMNKQLKFIMRKRYDVCDLLEFTLACFEDYKNCSVTHSSGYEQIWVYADFPDKYYITTFPVDLLYINARKGPRLFIRYIKHKLKIVKESLSQQSNQQP